LQHRQLLFQFGGQPLVVGIEERDHVASGGKYPDVPRSSGSFAHSGQYQPDCAFGIPRNNFCGVVSALIVDNDDFVCWPALRQDRGKGAGKGGPGIVGRDHDAYSRFRTHLLLSPKAAGLRCRVGVLSGRMPQSHPIPLDQPVENQNTVTPWGAQIQGDLT
jgi:hypothetical protein